MVRCSFVCLLPSLQYFRLGQLLRCAHKRIVNITKDYMERKNIQVDLIRYRKIATLFTLETLKWEL